MTHTNHTQHHTSSHTLPHQHSPTPTHLPTSPHPPTHRAQAARRFFSSSPSPVQLQSKDDAPKKDPKTKPNNQEYEVDRYGRDRTNSPGGNVDIIRDKDGKLKGAGVGLNFTQGDSGVVMGGHGDVGVLNANTEGKERAGVKLGGGLARGVNTKRGEFGVLNAGLEASTGEDGFTLGVGASLMDWAARGDRANAEKTDNALIRAGLSGGVGFGVRGHWGDEDKDGKREWGFGFDVGPLSVDAKSEWFDQQMNEYFGD